MTKKTMDELTDAEVAGLMRSVGSQTHVPEMTPDDLTATRGVVVSLHGGDDGGARRMDEVSYPGYVRVRLTDAEIGAMLRGETVQVRFPPCASGMTHTVHVAYAVVSFDLVTGRDRACLELTPVIPVNGGVTPVVTLRLSYS